MSRGWTDTRRVRRSAPSPSLWDASHGHTAAVSAGLVFTFKADINYDFTLDGIIFFKPIDKCLENQSGNQFMDTTSR